MSVKEQDRMPCKTSKRDAIQGTVIGGFLFVLAILYALIIVKGGL